jgi:WD40 repeat protein
VALSFRGETLAYPDAEFKGLILENFETQKAVPVHFARGVTLTAVAFSPRRHVVAAATSDFRITIYDAASGEIRLAFDQHKTVIGAIAFFADSELVVSGDYDGTVLLWNAESGEVKRRLAGHTDRIYELAVTRNGNMVASASADRTVRVWDCASDASPRIANVFRDEARSVSFSPDGSLLAAGSRELLLRIWDTGTYQELEPIRGSHRPGATFLPDGRLTFASWERRQALCTLDPRTRDCALEPKGWVLDLAFSRRPGDLILAARADRAATSVNRGGKPAPTVDLYRVDKDQATRLDPLLPGFPVGCLAVSPRGTWAVGDADGARVKLFEDLTQRSAVELTAQAAQGVRGAAFSADGARLAVGFSDGRIALWRMDPQTGAWKPGKEWQAHDAAVTELAFGPTSHATLVTGGWDRTVKTWNCDAAEMAQPPRACANTIMSIAFSPSGETLAASHFDGDIDIWDGRTSDHRVLRGHGLHVESIAFLNDGRTLVSAGGDRTLKFWDLPTGRERFTVEGGVKIFTSLAISPDETVIAAGTRDGTIRLLRRATEEEVKSAGW